ncbi:MAG: hypothetical protein ABSE48_03810 [Verrucomicrobiota bacterium]|jgi:hypothetical protein
MINLAHIRQQRNWGSLVIELLLNAPQLLLIIYGLTCIATLHGKMLMPVRSAVYSSLHLVPVAGALASTVGWEYVGFGLFIYYSDGNAPGENRMWIWHFGRGLIRWVSLAVAFLCFVKAQSQAAGTGLYLAGFAPYLLAKILAFIAGLVALFSFCFAMFQREGVMQELNERGCQPLRIWWIPAAYWVPWASFLWATGFRVVYSDPAGVIHRGYCIVYRSFLKDQRWGNRRVRWLKDTAA